MKIKSLKLKNFAQFTDFEIEYNDKITKLVGTNGSGKTTVGNTAFWACLKGIAEKNSNGQLLGERFRFIGSEGSSADIKLTLIDSKTGSEIEVTNHITKNSNQIKFKAPEGYAIDESWLKNLLSVSLMSAKNFTEIDGKKQALLLGIDTSSYDKEITALKEEFTGLNRDYRNLGERDELEKVDPVSISKLIEEKYKMDKENGHIDVCEKWINHYEDEISTNNFEIERLKNNITDLIQSNKDAFESRQKMKEEVSRLTVNDISIIKNKIANSEETNKKAQLYQDWLKWSTTKDEKTLEIEANKEKQKKESSKRLDYIKSFKFGIDGLSCDDKGSLLLNNRPIKSPYFSKGELELIVAKLHSSQNPELKVRFIDDFELLDEDNQKLIVDSLLESGFQIITAEVGKKTHCDNSVLLKECTVDNN